MLKNAIHQPVLFGRYGFHQLSINGMNALQWSSRLWQPNNTRFQFGWRKTVISVRLLRSQPMTKYQSPMNRGIASTTIDRNPKLCSPAYQEPSRGQVSGLSVLEQPNTTMSKWCSQGACSQTLRSQTSRLSEAAGIRLLTGATDTATLELMDDKPLYRLCQQHGHPCVASWQFDNAGCVNGTASVAWWAAVMCKTR